MLDLSPEKLIVLLAVGLVVLGPHKLPVAARGLGNGLAKARRLASALTDPISSTIAEPLKANITEPLTGGLVEPRQAIEDAVADLRSTIASHPLPGASPPHPSQD